MRAIILAAGEGSRLYPLTRHRPKCLVELAGRSLLAYQLKALHAAGIRDVWVVTGPYAEQIAALGHRTRHNPQYGHTNMVASLMHATDLLDGADDVLIAYGDILYEPAIIQALCNCDASICTAVDRGWLPLSKLRTDNPLSDADTLKIDPSGWVSHIGGQPGSYDDIDALYIGLTKVSAALASHIVTIYKQLKRHNHSDLSALQGMYMTDFLQQLIDHGQRVRAVFVDKGWLEIDSVSDLELYSTLLDDGHLNRFCRISELC